MTDSSSNAAPETLSGGAPTAASNINGEPQIKDPAAARARLGRVWRGGAAVMLGSAVPLFCAAASRPVPLGVMLGSLGIGVVAYGSLELIGSFDARPRDQVVKSSQARQLLPALLQAASAVVLLLVLLRLAVAGGLPLQVPLLAVSVPALFLWLTLAIGRAATQLGVFAASEDGQPRHLWQHQGFWIIATSSVLYLPLLGSFGLVDCWETHYGEVAREMLARQDWISLWWGDEGWFWSKPILNFWVQGLSFSALGVEYVPDGMIRNISAGRLPQPEWAARLPMFSMALVGQYLLYKGTAQFFGRRAALLGGLILLTCPFWYFLARQSISDMPYVGPLSAAMGLLLLALRADDTEQAKVYELRLGTRTLALSGFHLLFGAIIALSSSQILYLVAQNFTVDISGPDFGLRWHLDEVRSGSAGNCGLPGNAACQVDADATGTRFQPAYLGLLWAGALAALLWLQRGERRIKRLYYLAAWLFVALSFMAKGAPGFILPVATFALFLLATNRLVEVRRTELLGFGLVLAAVALPWFVQQYARHGTIFFDQLFTHHMYNRAFAHLHDTNAGDDTSFRYYIWQLGYGLFPWSGIVALGNLWCLGRSFAPAESRAEIQFRDATYLFLFWELTTFGMFSITGTKFHHYILPLVPAAAMLGGVLLNEMLGPKRSSSRSARSEWLTVGGLCLCCLLLVYGLSRLFPGAAIGEAVVASSSASRILGISASVIGAGGALILLLAGRDMEVSRSSSSVLMGSVGLASAVIVTLVGRDLVVSSVGNVPGPARLIHLFIYKYDRPWPDALDFRNVLWAFTLVAALACLLLMVARWRRQLTFALCFVAVLCSAWAVDVYLVEAAPHLGQRVTVSEYYRRRAGPEEPLVAYQLNWKGENFYTSNHVPTFKSSGKAFKDWVKVQKGNGVRVMFFTTEHPRITALKRELGTVSQFDVITDKSVNAQFVLARVVL